MKKRLHPYSINRPVDHRSFLQGSLLAGGAVAGAGLLADGMLVRAQAQTQESGPLNPGDAAILRFLAAAELIESDLGTQYAELRVRGAQPVDFNQFETLRGTKLEDRRANSVSRTSTSTPVGTFATAGITFRRLTLMATHTRFFLLASVLTLVPFLRARAQNLPLGTVVSVKPEKCPAGFLAGSFCQSVTVGCPGLTNLAANVGHKSGTGRGTVAMLSGSSGTEIIDGQIAIDLNNFGFDIEQRTWPTAWEKASPPDILTAACREATLINYMASISPGPLRLIGKSAGSAAIAYAMIWYQGIANLVTHVSLLAGPPLSDISQGCEVPRAAAITVEPTNGASFTNTPQYVGTFETGVSTFTGTQCLPPNNTTTEDSEWLAQSVIQPGVVVSFPTVSIAGFVCNNGQNNSSAQAQIFYNALSNTSYTLTAITNCSGAEGVEQGTTPQGTSGTLAIEQDIDAH